MYNFQSSIAFDLGQSQSRFYKKGELVLAIPSEQIKDDQTINTFINRGEIASLWPAEVFLKKAIQSFHKPLFGLIKNQFTALVSVPAYTADTGIRAFRDVFETVGAKEVYMLPDVFIAALGLGLAPTDVATLVDFGAGKTTITTIDECGIAKSELLDICGKVLDKIIQNYLKQTYDLLIDSETARKLKEEHIDLNKATTDWPILVSGKGKDTNNQRSIYIRHTELVACVSDEINDLIDKIITHINWLEDDLSKHIQQKGIYLTGNGFKMKGLTNLVAEKITVLPESYSGIDYLSSGLKKLQTEKVSDILLMNVIR